MLGSPKRTSERSWMLPRPVTCVPWVSSAERRGGECGRDCWPRAAFRFPAPSTYVRPKGQEGGDETLFQVKS